MNHSAQINQLFIYPVKSLKGIAVDQARITPLGFEFDRHWMIINPDNKFVTQRKHANMVLITTRLSETHLHLSKDGMPEIAIPFISKNKDNIPFSAVIWNDECQVIDEGEAISQWITDALESKKKLRLVKMAPQTTRPQSKPERFGIENTTQFADAVAYLLCNQASLDALNNDLEAKGFSGCIMEQFRPNIVISSAKKTAGIPEFQEHFARTLTHTSKNHNYEFVSRDACQRCIVPTININTAEKHPQQEPYKTLIELNPMPNNRKAPAFGQNLTVGERSTGKIVAVGDFLTINMDQP